MAYQQLLPLEGTPSPDLMSSGEIGLGKLYGLVFVQYRSLGFTPNGKRFHTIDEAFLWGDVAIPCTGVRFHNNILYYADGNSLHRLQEESNCIVEKDPILYKSKLTSITVRDNEILVADEKGNILTESREVVAKAPTAPKKIASYNSDLYYIPMNENIVAKIGENKPIYQDNVWIDALTPFRDDLYFSTGHGNIFKYDGNSVNKCVSAKSASHALTGVFSPNFGVYFYGGGDYNGLEVISMGNTSPSPKLLKTKVRDVTSITKVPMSFINKLLGKG